jgi:PAS domain-containing protein
MSAEPLHEIAERSTQLVWLTSADGLSYYFNRPSRSYLGLSELQMPGWAWQWFVHPTDLPQVLRAWKLSAQLGRVCYIEYRLRRVDGVYHRHVAIAMPQTEQAEWFWVSTDLDLLTDDLLVTVERLRQLAAVNQAIVRETCRALQASDALLCRCRSQPLQTSTG